MDRNSGAGPRFNKPRILLAGTVLTIVLASGCGESSSLNASGYLSGSFTKGGQVLDGTDIAPICGQMEGKFGSAGGYVLLEWDDQQTTLKVNFKRMNVTEPYGYTEKQTWDRTYSGPGVLQTRPPDGSTPGKYVFSNVKLNLTSGADWQEDLPIDEAARREDVAAGIEIVNPPPDNPAARALVTGPDGMVHGKAQPPPPGGGNVVLNGILLCEGGGWFGGPN